RTPNGKGSIGNQSPEGENTAKINREDASVLGLKNGDSVIVKTDAGSAVLRVKISSSPPRNTLIVRWSDELRKIIPLRISKWGCLDIKSVPCVVERYEEDIH
ncbi:MAG TPA: hypothetical protein EYP08_05360, partial [Pyrodictiaceae archaeon]|nr:hypothetical protein [Pyrodictiaceae archaeon]